MYSECTAHSRDHGIASINHSNEAVESLVSLRRLTTSLHCKEWTSAVGVGVGGGVTTWRLSQALLILITILLTVILFPLHTTAYATGLAVPSTPTGHTVR